MDDGAPLFGILRFRLPDQRPVGEDPCRPFAVGPTSQQGRCRGAVVVIVEILIFEVGAQIRGGPGAERDQI